MVFSQICHLKVVLISIKFQLHVKSKLNIFLKYNLMMNNLNQIHKLLIQNSIITTFKPVKAIIIIKIRRKWMKKGKTIV